MTLAAEITTLLSQLDQAWLPVVDGLLKATLVLVLAGLVSLTLTRASAAVRHLVWTLALASALLLPVLSVALPRWQLPLVTLASPVPALSVVAESPRSEPALGRRAADSAFSSGPGSEAPASPSLTAVAPRVAPGTALPSLSMVLIAIWAAGIVVIVGRLAIGLAAVAWLSRRTVRVVDAPWLALAVELASGLGITRRLRFLESARASMPMAAGIFTPSVLMPEDANRWPLERLRIVLLHELAHVKRRDCLTHVIAQLACAIHWFNPLAWMAARHIRTERERACDDLVLVCGTRGSDYAEELLEIARVMRGGRYPALLAGATLAMAHRSQLEGRLMAILDPKVPRSGVSPVRAALAVGTVLCALPVLAAMQPWAVATVEATAVPDSLERNGVVSTERAAGSQVKTEPSPSPQPRPTPTPQPQMDSATGAEIAQAIGDAIAQEAGVRVDAAVQGAVQGAWRGAAQADVQAAWQGVVEGVVQGAVHGALQGTGAVSSNAQEGKRAAADPRMVAALTAALKDSDKEVRETAMHALVQLRDPAIFEPLVQALKDASADVREQAAHGLSQLRDKRAVDPLIAALKDQNADVRESVVHALSQLRDPRSVDGLMAALGDTSPDVREQAAFALGQLRDKRAAPALAALMKDADADVREQAVFALGQMRDASAIDGLTLALRDTTPDVREQAAFALGQIRDARSVAPLISALKDENADVREQAAFALGQIRDRGAVEALVIAIKDPSPDVREQVAFALGQLRDPRAIDALTIALKDASAEVRQKAAFALGQLAR